MRNERPDPGKRRGRGAPASGWAARLAAALKTSRRLLGGAPVGVRLLLASVVVASFVQLVHDFIEPIESYVLVAVGASRLSTDAQTPDCKPHECRVATLAIDASTFYRAALPMTLPAAAAAAAQASADPCASSGPSRRRPGEQGDFGYGGRTPLDRCTTRDYVCRILDAEQFPALRVVGLDLDVSPMLDERQDACSDEIVDALGEAVARRGIGAVLTRPLLESAPVELQKRQSRWESRARALGVAFASPTLINSQGAVLRMPGGTTGCSTLGELMKPANAALRATSHCKVEALDAEEAESHAQGSIGFHAYRAHGLWAMRDALDRYSVDLGDQIRRLRGEAVEAVLLGANYDSSDRYVTPLGHIPGVEVHAAISLSEVKGSSRLSNFLIDIALGWAWGGLVHWVWTCYFRQRVGLPLRGRHRDRELAYGWLAGLFALGIVLGLALVAISGRVLESRNLWINPLPMMLGMTLDAWVLASVSVAVHQLQHAGAAGHEGPAATAHWTRELARDLPLLLSAAVVVLACYDMATAAH